jgi:FtsH-binding integral membrane protein
MVMSELGINRKVMRKFGIFAVILFVGLWIGNTVWDIIPLSIGNPFIDTIIEWVIVIAPSYVILRRTRYGRESVDARS